jgi:hypothetical protein
MEIIKEELENFIFLNERFTRSDSFILSIHIRMLQGKWAHEVMNDGLIYLRVFFDKSRNFHVVDILNRDWNDYLLSDYIQFQREVKLNKILTDI